MRHKHRAVIFSEFGGPEVLRLTELDTPNPGHGEVRLAVRAAGVNPIDWKLRSGAMADVLPVQLPMVPGQDVSGVVDALGEGVHEFAVGDEVFGKVPGGGYAERALAGAGLLARKPAAVSWELAAALPVAATAAVLSLDTLDVRSGETIVINGAAGGVGTLAVQLAVRRGANVIGTASEPNHGYLAELGATPVRYGEGLAAGVRRVSGGRVDAALDCAGHGSLPALVELTRDRRRVVSIADPTAPALGVRFVRGEPRDVGSVLAETALLAVGGVITMPVANIYELQDAADAQRRSEAGHVRGKLILVPDA